MYNENEEKGISISCKLVNNFYKLEVFTEKDSIRNRLGISEKK
jgi:hypothetical protein